MDDTDSQGSSFEDHPANIHVFAATSTLHGFSHIFARHHSSLRRFTWTVAFLTSFALLLYQSSNRVVYYWQFPHVTRLDEVAVGNLPFPAITICNVNEFRISKFTKNDMRWTGFLLGFLDKQDNPIYPSDEEFGYIYDEETKRQLYDQREWLLQLSNFDDNYSEQAFDMYEFYGRAAHNLSDFLLACIYRGQICNTTYFKEVYTRYGKCYTFNSADLSLALNTSKGGVDNGLELLLDVQQNEYMPVWAENDEISIEAGFKVQVHHQSEPPFIHELGFGIAPGFQTLVATQEQRITFLPDPWGDCVEKGGALPDQFFYKNYSISACRLSCETNWVVQKCKCKMVHMIGNASTPYCNPEQYKNCADRALDYLMSQDTETCNCKTPCEVIRYNLASSMLALPSIKARSYLAMKYGVTEEYVKNNFLKLNIFFEALNYETIDQKVAYEVAGLLGDIGGQMGLFIGASILTLLEMFDYVYEVVKDKTWGRSLRKQPRTNDSRAGSRIGMLRALLGRKSDRNNFDDMTSQAVQFSRTPGTVVMTSFPQEQQYTQHFNGGGVLSRQGVPLYPQHQHSLNQPRSMPYTTVAYKSTPDYLNDDEEFHPLKQVVEPLPPPPPQYLGRSMMTLDSSKKYDGERRGRDTSHSYDDLMNIGTADNIIGIHDPVDYSQRSRNPYTASGVTTLPNFRAGNHGFMPLHINDDYAQNHRFDYTDDRLPHCASSPKFTYTKTLETDIV